MKYPLVSRIFHWVMAAAILFMVAAGLYMTRQEYSPFVISLYGWHKSVGFLILVAVALRLSWRLAFVRLPEAPGPKWQQRFARYTHYALYLLMFMIPLSGWAMSSAKGFPVSVFGWFVLPDIAPVDKSIGHFFYEVHEYTAYTLIALSSLHILAALYHQFKLKDGLMRRMWAWVAVFGLVTLSTQAADQPTSWQLVKDQSYIKFTATMNGAPSKGEFAGFDAVFTFDESQLISAPLKASPDITLTVDLTDIQTTYPAVANELQKDVWFDTANHPEGVYKVIGIKPSEEADFTLEGDLTLKGKTISVPAPVYVEKEDGQVVFKGSTTVSRLAFNIGEGPWAGTGTIKDDIQVDYFFTLKNVGQ